MKAFEYTSPKTIDEAIQVLDKYQDEAALLAGGTDLLSLMKEGIATPSVVVSLKSVEEGKAISSGAGGGLQIGALATIDDLIESPVIAKQYPSLLQAAKGVTSPQIRALGTVGGDLCQHPRCWYYRNGFGLLGMQDGKSLIPDGDNRYHAVLGTSGTTYYVNPSSLAPALVALGAEVVIQGQKGERRLPVGSFYRVPMASDEREYDLNPDEIVVGIVVPPSSGPNATYEVRQREALDWPLATASVALKLNGQKVEQASIVLGHVAPVPWDAKSAAQGLQGKTLNEQTAAIAGKAATSGAKSLSRNGYKIRLAQVAVKRALLLAAGKEV